MHNTTYIIRSILTICLFYVSVFAGNTTLNSKPLPANILPNLPLVLHTKQHKTKPVTRPEYIEGQVIVKYKSNIQKSHIAQMASSNNLQVLKSYSRLTKKNIISVLKSNKTTNEMIKILSADPNVESVSPNYIRYLKTVPNDPNFNDLWGMHNEGQTGGITDADIDATEAWNARTGSSDVVVAVFDTGIDHTHQDLIPNLWINQDEIADDNIDNDNNGYIDDIYGYDVASDTLGNNDGDPMDVHGHGTHVSGTIGAKGNDSYGIVGVNWDVKIMSLKIFPPGSGATDTDILEAIDYIHTMRQRGVNIVAINASYGGTGGDQTNPMNAAIQGLGDVGIIFCAAAGNEATDNDTIPHFPSSYNADNIISVASTDSSDLLSSFSNYGETSVDIAAPGSAILSTMKYAVEYAPQEGDPYFISIDGTELWNTDSNDATSWSFDPINTHSSPYAITDSLDSNYLNNQIKQLYPQSPIDLSGIQDPNLAFGFWAKVDLENNFDFLLVFFSQDGGTTWTQMNTFTGENIAMQSYSIEIPDSFQTNNFLYLFYFASDISVVRDGVSIDDIGIGVGTRINNRYATWSGTSMATPHVAGAIGLMASAYHAEGVQDRISRILTEGDILPSLSNKVVTDSRMNIDSSIRTQLGVCPVNMYVIQGTEVCTDGNVSEYPKEIPKGTICPSGEIFDQGTQSCIDGIATSDPGTYPIQENCELIQGTDTCVL